MAFSQTVAIEMASASDDAGPAARGLSGALPGQATRHGSSCDGLA